MQGAQTESRFRGIGRYTMSLTRAIIRNKGEHEIILALNGLFPDTIEPIRAAFDGLLSQENIRIWYAPGPVYEHEFGNAWRHDVAEKIREFFISSLEPDIVLVSSLFEGYADNAVTGVGPFQGGKCFLNTFVVLYDLIPLINREVYLKPVPAYESYYLRKIESLKKSTGCLAISEFSATEGKKKLDIKDGSIVNISTACDPVFCKMDISKDLRSSFLKKYEISNSFIMYTGGADNRKNLSGLVKAYAKLPQKLRKDTQLVMVGKIAEHYVYELRKIAQTLGVSNSELVFTNYVEDSELAIFYNLCSVFVFPSWYEGFGLPALEAMSCGAPVIGSSCTSIPEVIGMKEALFDPLNVLDMSNKILMALTDNKFRSKLIDNGLIQARKFSWDESAKIAIKRFEDTLHPKVVIRKERDDMLPGLIRFIADTVPSNISNKELVSVAGILDRLDKKEVGRQIFVDISGLVIQDIRTGVQRVTRSVVKELLKNPPAGYVIVPVYSTLNSNGFYCANTFTAKFFGLNNDKKDEPINYNSGDIFIGLELQHHTIINNKNYLINLSNKGVKIYFIVYDLLSILLPKLFNPQLALVHEEWLKTICNFDGVICISNTVAQEFTKWYKKQGIKRSTPFKIGWFHLGADVDNSVPSKGLPDNVDYVIESLKKYPTFLAVGTVEPRKGQTQVLSAFELLWKQGVKTNLVIVGKQGWMVETLIERISKHRELNKHLFWFDGISDEYLEKVYTVSSCLIAASEGEGFGLPLIEAAKHKLPIIARDIPIFHEVVGEHAYYFSGFEPKDLADSINEWIKLNKDGRIPQSTNMLWLTWKQSTQQLLKSIIPIINDNSSQKIYQNNTFFKNINYKKDASRSYFRILLNRLIIMLILSPYRKALKKIYYKLRLNKIRLLK